MQDGSVTPLLNPGATGAVGIVMNYPTKPFTFGAVIPESLHLPVMNVEPQGVIRNAW